MFVFAVKERGFLNERMEGRTGHVHENSVGFYSVGDRKGVKKRVRERDA